MKAELFKKNKSVKNYSQESNKSSNLFAELIWEKFNDKKKEKESIFWKRYYESSDFNYKKGKSDALKKQSSSKLGSLGRSIVFDDSLIGPDISWIVPPGIAWNKKYKFDFLARGHNTKIPEPKKRNFFGWNDGDAVGLFSYQFLQFKRSSFGINLGVRSLYQGDDALGGSTSIGEGISSGFRWDYALTKNSGIAFGAEQLIHFDNQTDTGRNLYLTASKSWWRGSDELGRQDFPLDIATAGIGTGRMAVGTVKGLCSDLFGGSGTETQTKRSLCWSPVFSLARVHNQKLSTYFEYNSRFFLVGSSLVPFNNVPIRGNLGLILSDHVDNYKLHNFSELNWVFNISLGF
tara:strand:- start:518 stop:1558 length:1041 start_codon:yes stop_codon:yes gene_type:complete